MASAKPVSSVNRRRIALFSILFNCTQRRTSGPLDHPSAKSAEPQLAPQAAPCEGAIVLKLRFFRAPVRRQRIGVRGMPYFPTRDRRDGCCLGNDDKNETRRKVAAGRTARD